MAPDRAEKPQRRLRRFFSDQPLPKAEGEELRLSANQSRHLAQVHRLQAGDRCWVLDGSGDMAEAVIIGFDAGGEAKLRLEGRRIKSAPFPLRIKAYVAIPQRYKFETLVEKAQELGVEEIHPIETQRTIIKMGKDNHKKVMDRWKRVAQEAAKQAYSLQLIQFFAPVSFKKAIREAGDSGETIAFFHPSEDGLSFRKFYEELKEKFEKKPSKETGFPINIFVGPEGGFTDEEESLIMAQPTSKKINLGDTVLKVDTAFYGILAGLRFLFAE